MMGPAVRTHILVTYPDTLDAVAVDEEAFDVGGYEVLGFDFHCAVGLGHKEDGLGGVGTCQLDCFAGVSEQ